MRRKLFCEISPLTFKISTKKEKLKRNLILFLDGRHYASDKDTELLSVLVYDHNSLIRRQLGNVDMQLQDNKAVNLKLASTCINGVLIRPGETFSFWSLVGDYTSEKGYLEGLIIKNNMVDKGIGGGLCQFTNLIHWMILHTPMEIIEHHHHNQFDMFPDFDRAIPFGTGTSISYNYLDYRFVNNTDITYQLITYTTDTHLCGQIRATKGQNLSYHIVEKDNYFNVENGAYFRNNEIIRKVIDKKTGITIKEELIIKNHSRVLYDISLIKEELIRR